MDCILLLIATVTLSGCQSPSAPEVTANASGAGASGTLNAEFRNPALDAAQWQDRFERESREIYRQRQAILNAVRVRSGETIADVGAGSGLFTMLFAEAVGPNGKVYAVDISTSFLQLIDQRAAEAGVKNVQTILASAQATQLPRNSVDRAFICDTYHHFEQPGSTMASIHQALRPGGELVVIDFIKIPGQSSAWIMSHVRATQAEVIREIEAAGFKLVEEEALLKENYFLRFRKIGKR